MRIPCPFCGPRDLGEYTVLGAVRRRPEIAVADLDGEEARAAFADYVYARDNPAGPHAEHWYHGPCQSWLVVTRDTRSHAILAVALAGEETAG